MSKLTDTLYIEGMSCGHCIKAVREALESVEGVEVDDVVLGTARVTYDTDKVDRSEIVEAVEEEGYHVQG